MALLAGCPAPATRADRLPLAADGQAVVLRPEDDRYTGGVVLWQGFELGWTYNHRVNRLGSLVLPGAPTCSRAGTDGPVCEAVLLGSAASGTGPDTASVRGYLSLVGAREVSFSSVVQEVVLHGTEGAPIEVQAEVPVPLDAFGAAASGHLALLNGVDLYALESADKLLDLEVHLGEPVVQGDVARVPVQVRARLDCTTSECPREPDVDYSLWIGVVVASAGPEALQVQDVGADHTYSWDDATPPDPAVAGRPLEVQGYDTATDVLALRGFRLGIDREQHLLTMGVSVQPDPLVRLLFQNWRADMKTAHPPESWTAFREEGTATWRGDVVALRFASASVAPLVGEGSVRWEGWGADASEPRGPATVTRRVSLALRRVVDIPRGTSPLEAAGYPLVDAGQLRGDPASTVRAVPAGRDAPPLARACEAAPADWTAGQRAAATIADAVGHARVLAQVAPAVLAAPGLEPAAPDAARVVQMGEGAAAGGLWYVRPAEGGFELGTDDGWGGADGVDFGLRGLLGVKGPTQDLAFRGVLTRAGSPTGDLDGTVELAGPPDARRLAVRGVGACGERVELTATLRPGCDTWDGLRETTLTVDGAPRALELDARCDGCGVVDGERVCR